MTRCPISVKCPLYGHLQQLPGKVKVYSRHHTVNIIELAVNTVNTRRSHDFNVDPDVREIRVREFLDDNFSTTSFEQMIQIRVHQTLGRPLTHQYPQVDVPSLLALPFPSPLCLPLSPSPRSPLVFTCKACGLTLSSLSPSRVKRKNPYPRPQSPFVGDELSLITRAVSSTTLRLAYP